MTGRPILVVGAAGQVGRELMLRNDPQNPRLAGLMHGDLDICDAGRVRAVVADLAPSAIINAAAYTAVDKAESEPEAAFAVNRDGAANLAATCAEARIPLLHVSTDYVFDGKKPGAYVETDPVAPLGVYGASKLAGEEAVRARLDRHVVLRTAWVHAGHGANFVRTMLRLAKERDELRVVGDQYGGPTPAGAIAEALLAIATQLEVGNANWGTFHLCGTPVTSWCGFARTIVVEAARHIGRRPVVTPIATADYPTPAARPANSALDCSKLLAAFGLAQPDWRLALPGIVEALLAAPG